MQTLTWGSDCLAFNLGGAELAFGEEGFQRQEFWGTLQEERH